MTNVIQIDERRRDVRVDRSLKGLCRHRAVVTVNERLRDLKCEACGASLDPYAWIADWARTRDMRETQGLAALKLQERMLAVDRVCYSIEYKRDGWRPTATVAVRESSLIVRGEEHPLCCVGRAAGSGRTLLETIVVAGERALKKRKDGAA